MRSNIIRRTHPDPVSLRPGLAGLVSILAIFCLLPASHAFGGNLVVPSARIPGEISDGAPSPPAPKPALPDFEVKGTVVCEMHVVEAPPMSGLPPVEGTIRVTVNLVEDPKLPDPAPPAPPDNPRADPRLAESAATVRQGGGS